MGPDEDASPGHPTARRVSVHKRKSDGKYVVQVSYGMGADGKRIRRTVGYYLTKREAQAEERKALLAHDQGIDITPERITVRDMMERYLADAQTRCAPKTMERYREINATYVIPYFGTMTLAKVRPAHVVDWKAKLHTHRKLRGGILSPKTAHHAFSLLATAFKWAVGLQMVQTSPLIGVPAPRIPRPEITAHGPEAISRLLDVASETRWWPLITFALATGMRRGELVALRWSSVDYEAGRVTIRESLTQVAGSVQTKSTKTGRIRTVPLSRMALTALQRQEFRQASERTHYGSRYVESEYVFTPPGGGVLKPHNISVHYGRIAKEAGVPTALHALRHTAATWLLSGGVDVRNVSAILGHSNASTTLNTYAHAAESIQVKAVDAIERRLTTVKAIPPPLKGPGGHQIGIKRFRRHRKKPVE